MYLTLLIIALGVLLIIDYFLFGKELATPAISFNLGFFVCALILLNFTSIWDVHIHENTFGLILGGNILLSLSAYLYNLASKSRLISKPKEHKFYLISVRRL